MIGVIVVPGPSERMHGLDARRSLALLPLGDRPVIQHIVEYLLSRGFTSIEMVMEHAPERVEALLGNGDRWGCKFNYHLATQPDRPYRSLRVIAGLKTEPWMLIHAEHFPCFETLDPALAKTLLYNGVFDRSEDGSVISSTPQWGGTAVFPAGPVSEEFASLTREELVSHIEEMARDGRGDVAANCPWIDVSTPLALLESQNKLLRSELDSLMISGTERRPGIWIARNVVIHPTVVMNSPVYVGPNSHLNRGSRLGPNTVVSGDCIIDSNTIVENSLVMAGSYIGESLEVSHAVVDRNLLVNVRLGTGVDILENFLLGGLEKPLRQNRVGGILRSLVAALLFVLLLPLWLGCFLYYALVRKFPLTSVGVVSLPVNEDVRALGTYLLPCYGRDAWGVLRPAGWGAFTRQFLPGLPAVVSGKLNFVGLPPRTPEEIQELSPEWRTLYLAGRAGLITEASVAIADDQDPMQMYLADAYYSVRRSRLYDLRLAGLYFMRMFKPVTKR